MTVPLTGTITIKTSLLFNTKNANDIPAMHLRSFNESLILIYTHLTLSSTCTSWLNLLGGKTNLSPFGLVLISNCSLCPRDQVKCRYYLLTYGFPFLKRHSSANLFSIIFRRRNGQNTFVVLKACVHYFLSIFFSPNDSSSKTIRNIFYFIEKALFVLEISKFLYFLPFFSTLSRFKRTNGSGIIYDVMNWLA